MGTIDDTISKTFNKALVVDTDWQSPVINSTKHGIGRIEAISSWLFVNNIGKNIQVTSLDGTSSMSSSSSKKFARTEFPDLDEESLLDQDMHAFLHDTKHNLVLASNHFGTMRAFDLSTMEQANSAEPIFELQWFGDVERILLAGNHIFSSSPRGHETSDEARPGVFISTSLDDTYRKAFEELGEGIKRYPISSRQFLPEWGYITGIALDETANRLAVLANNRVALFELSSKADDALNFQTAKWERTLFRPATWMRFHPTEKLLFVAGGDVPLSEATFDNWDEVIGGTLACIDSESGTVLMEKSLQESVAWGYGAVPLTLSTDGNAIYMVDRHAGLFRFSTTSGVLERLYGPSENDQSLGLGHITMASNQIIAGFNRGGYRLFHYEI